MEGPASYVAAWLAPYLGAALVLLLHPVKGRAKGIVGVLSIFTAAVYSTLIAVKSLGTGEPLEHSFTWVPSLNVTIGYYADTLSTIMALVVSWLSFLIAVYSLEYMGEDPGQTRYWFFFSFFVGSMQLLVLSDNLIAMFIGWEGTGLASYALIGHWFTDEEDKCVGDPGRTALGIPMCFTPSHAGLRALVFTRLGDVGLLVGTAAIHILLGTTSFHAMVAHADVWAGGLFAKGLLSAFLAFFILGAMAKSAQFPFHEWLVTAMTGPTSVSALIHAATMVKAGVYFLLRFTPIFVAAAHVVRETMGLAAYNTFIHFFGWVALIGGFTAFMMATMAVVARELKLVLAFSTASQLGYMFLGTAAGGMMGEGPLAVFAGLSHLVSHAVFKAALFLVAGAVIHAVHSRFMDDMGGLARFMKWSALSMLLAGLSLSGIPPFAGFWTKDTVLDVAHEAGATIPWLLGVITALLTAAYTFRMIIMVFYYKPSHHVEEHGEHIHEAHPLMLLPYLTLAVLSLLIGLAWPWIEDGLVKLIPEATLALEGESLHVAINAPLMAMSVTLALLGLGISVYIYQARLMRPYDYVAEKPWLAKLHGFLYDRWYLNSIYYWVFVRGGAALARTLYRYVNNLVVDSFYHRFLPWFFMSSAKGLYATSERAIDVGFHVKLVDGTLAAARNVRRLQTGVLNHYVLTMWLGLATLILIVIWYVGWIV